MIAFFRELNKTGNGNIRYHLREFGKASAFLAGVFLVGLIIDHLLK